MALQTSGAISLLDIQGEFDGVAPHSLSEYYSGGSLVPAGNTSIPTSGAISFGDFYGASNIVSLSLEGTNTSFGSAALLGDNNGFPPQVGDLAVITVSHINRTYYSPVGWTRVTGLETTDGIVNTYYKVLTDTSSAITGFDTRAISTTALYRPDRSISSITRVPQYPPYATGPNPNAIAVDLSAATVTTLAVGTHTDFSFTVPSPMTTVPASGWTSVNANMYTASEPLTVESVFFYQNPTIVTPQLVQVNHSSLSSGNFMTLAALEIT